MQKYVANRPIYKQPRPKDIPAPPEGYGYVGTGVPDMPFLNPVKTDDIYIACRFVPEGTEAHDGASTLGCWSTQEFKGIRGYGHYAIPMNLWKKIEYPPELKKSRLEH